MRLGILSDIHCNIEALDTALARMGPVDELLCAGDAVYQFRFSNEVVARLRERGARFILGNHEEILLSAAGVRARESPKVDRELLAWTSAHPNTLRTTLDGKTLFMFHATPWEPYRDYLYPSSAELQKLAHLEADFVIYGHTHYQLERRIGDALVINPGSAGEPRDPHNGFQLSYAVLDTIDESVTFDNFPDPTRVVARHSGVSPAPGASDAR